MGSWTGAIPDDGPAAEAVALIGADAGRALGGGPVRSRFGHGELVVTEIGLHACDLPSGEVVVLPWSTFDRDRVDIGGPDGSSTVVLDLDGEPLALILDSALAAFVVGSSGRYWFQRLPASHHSESATPTGGTIADGIGADGGGVVRDGSAGDLFVTARTTAPARERSRGADHARSTVPAPVPGPVLLDPRPSVGSADGSPPSSFAGGPEGTDEATAAVRHRGHPVGMAAAATALVVVGAVALWPGGDDRTRSRPDDVVVPVTASRPGAVTDDPGSTPVTSTSAPAPAGNRGVAGAPAGPTIVTPRIATADRGVTSLPPPTGDPSEPPPPTQAPDTAPSPAFDVGPPTTTAGHAQPAPGSVMGAGSCDDADRQRRPSDGDDRGRGWRGGTPRGTAERADDGRGHTCSDGQ